jgi:hypothetical protein
LIDAIIVAEDRTVGDHARESREGAPGWASPAAPWIAYRPDGSELFVDARQRARQPGKVHRPSAGSRGTPPVLKAATACDLLHARTDGRLA